MHSTLNPGDGYGTVDLAVKMLRAEGRVLHVSGRVGVADGTVHDEQGRLVGHGTCTCVINRAPKS